MNTPATPATETRNCLRCGRKLRSAEAVARGYGAGCWAKVRNAERTADAHPGAGMLTLPASSRRIAVARLTSRPQVPNGFYYCVTQDAVVPPVLAGLIVTGLK